MPRRTKSMKRSSRRANRRTVYRRRRGGALSMNSALPYKDFEAGLGGGDLKQGQEFLKANEAMHGGALGGADFKDAFSGSPLIPADMAGAARVAPLDAAFKEIAGMKDMEGGRRRRRASRKARRASRKSRKSRKASRKARRASRKARKASRKGRKASRKMRGGAAVTISPADFGAKEMLLDDYSGAGLNPEWKAAANPDDMAPRATETYRP